MIRLLAIDIDGTLLDSQGRVPDAHRDALTEVVRRGIRVALVTGRSFHFTRQVSGALPFPLTCIVNNGAVIKDPAGTTVVRNVLARDAALDILEHTTAYDDCVGLVFDRPPGPDEHRQIICDRMGIDVHEVIRAAATKPFGFVPYWPGPGLGGHCIPIDPFYLAWKARACGVETRFIELAGEINSNMPHWVLGKAAQALAARGKAVRGSRVLCLGVAYKKNVDDMRESPALELMRLLGEGGATLAWCDPHVPELRHPVHAAVPARAEPLSAGLLEKQDLVLIATDHDAFDFELILRHSKLIVDTRGRYLQPDPKVIKA